MKSMKDERYKHPYKKDKTNAQKAKEKQNEINKQNTTKTSSALFFKTNIQLKPPYHVLLDTNFIKFAQQKKLEIQQEAVKTLCGTVKLMVTDCVIAELELMREKAKLAMEILKSQPFTRLTCTHKGTYADDCIVERVKQHKCYIVGTNDRELRSRINKVPGVPIMRVKNGKFAVENMTMAVDEFRR